MNIKLQYLRQEIKRISKLQSELKPTRKLDKRGDRRLWEIEYDIVKNKSYATAILNTMHALRETGITHNVPEHYECYYSRDLSALQETLDGLECGDGSSTARSPDCGSGDEGSIPSRHTTMLDKLRNMWS